MKDLVFGYKMPPNSNDDTITIEALKNGVYWFVSDNPMIMIYYRDGKLHLKKNIDTVECNIYKL